MKKELQQDIKDFGVYNEVQVSGADDACYQGALPTLWVKRPKGAEIRCRLVRKGCYKESTDTDDTYADTPLLIILKLLLFLIDLTKNYKHLHLLRCQHCMPTRRAQGRGLRTTPC